MFAIVEIAGQQFKVEKDQEVFVHRLEGKEGSEISLDKVLLLDNNGKVEVGTPTLKTKISAQIVEHLEEPEGGIVAFIHHLGYSDFETDWSKLTTERKKEIVKFMK